LHAASYYHAMLTGPVIQAIELEVSFLLPLYIPRMSNVAHKASQNLHEIL